MIECNDDEFTFTEDSFIGAFFDDQFTNVEDELALLAMESYDNDSTTGSTTSTNSSAEVTVVKAAKRPAGSKVRSKVYRQRGTPINNNLAINSLQYKKDAKGGKYKFYAFPSFPVSDTMLFLPSAMAAYINSADSNSLTRLLLSHFDKECEVKINLLHDRVINTRRFIQFHDIMLDLHPDSIMCVHSTKLIGNELHAALYMKFTDCKVIYDSVARRVTDPTLQTLFRPGREKCFMHEIALNNASGDEKKEYAAFIHGESDFVVYVRLDMVLTIDESSRKISQYLIEGQVTSMKPTETSNNMDALDLNE